MSGSKTPRQGWLAVLARSTAAELSEHLATLPPLPPHKCLRGPEVGMVLLRGRAGGDGAAFNVGEATLARCTVLADGIAGHATALGRDTALVELAARIDAALQDPAWHGRLADEVIAPLAAAQEARRRASAGRAAATRVEFATLATMRG